MKVFTLVDHYLPGVRHGGPITTIANLVQSMPPEFQFWIYTRDRDQGDHSPYPGIERNTWARVGKAMVYYASGRARGALPLASLIHRTSPDVVYANSLFSRLTLRYLADRRLRLVPDLPTIIAPRGEMAQGALSLKAWKKRPFLAVAKAGGLFTGVTWQASTTLERAEILSVFAPWPVRVSSNVHVAPDVRADGTGAIPTQSTKAPGRVRLVFLSRVSRKKNLHAAPRYLSDVGPGGTSLDVFGPIEDQAYWRTCQNAFAREAPGVQMSYKGVLERQQVQSTLAGYDFLLLPTLGENFGHVIAEALSVGCPVIVSDRTPWRDLAAAGAGWDLPLEQPEAWRQVLRACVGMTREDHQKMRRDAMRFVASRGDREQVVGQNVAMFRAALADHDEATRAAVRRA